MNEVEPIKTWYQCHKKEVSLRKKEYYKKNRLILRKKTMERSYHQLGFTLAEKRIMWKSQGKKCGSCQKPISFFSSHLDHDHKTGKVRGILCRGCNNGLGHFDDSLEKLLNAIDYLKRTQLTP